MTPESIVALIGNIANRPDIREVQAKQVAEINKLLEPLVKLKEEIACMVCDPPGRYGQCFFDCDHVELCMAYRKVILDEISTRQQGT